MTRSQKILVAVIGLMMLAGDVFGKPSKGLLSVSYLGTNNLPRGMRNNNPGNIKISDSPWQGKVPIYQNTDQVFEQFESYVYGIRAMIKLLRDTYIQKWGLDTIRKIISKYAPTSENNTEIYIQSVAQKTGFGPDARLNRDKETLRRLVQAMAYHENGREAIDNVFFNYAWDLS